MRLRIHLALGDAALRHRLAALLRADPEVLLVAEPERADLVVAEAAPAPEALAQPAEEDTGALTARELEVLRLMGQGFGNRTIAAELGISTHTAKYHVASVLAKLGTHTRAEAVSRGLRRGLLPL